MKMSKLSNQTNSQDPQAVNSRIFVGNLNTFQCSKTDVERMFQIYGRLAGISMHKGYAFVQFTNPFDARNACHGEDGRLILSQTLDVNMVAEPKPHQIGRKRQNVSKTGNDWDYFYDSYCSSTVLRSTSIRTKKRKRLINTTPRMLSDAVNSNNINAAVAAAALAQQQQQHHHQQQQQPNHLLPHPNHHHHHHHHVQQRQQAAQQQQQQQQQHQQQVAAATMAAIAGNLLPQQQLLLHQHQQSLLGNANSVAAAAAAVAAAATCNGVTGGGVSGHAITTAARINGTATNTTQHNISVFLQQQQQQQQQQASASLGPYTTGGLQMKSSSVQNATSAIIAAANQTVLLNGGTTAGDTNTNVTNEQMSTTTNHAYGSMVNGQNQNQQQQQQKTSFISSGALQPLTLSLPNTYQSQQHVQQQQHKSVLLKKQTHHHLQQQQQLLPQQQEEQLTLNQQWGPFKLYSNPDTLICGNCRECFYELTELLNHKRSYCKLRFTCKCQDVAFAEKTPSTGAKLLCAVCKDAFVNPWDLMVHAQAAHMVNIYELGNEANNNYANADDADSVNLTSIITPETTTTTNNISNNYKDNNNDNNSNVIADLPNSLQLSPPSVVKIELNNNNNNINNNKNFGKCNINNKNDISSDNEMQMSPTNETLAKQATETAAIPAQGTTITTTPIISPTLVANKLEANNNNIDTIANIVAATSNGNNGFIATNGHVSNTDTDDVDAGNDADHCMDGKFGICNSPNGSIAAKDNTLFGIKNSPNNLEHTEDIKMSNDSLLSRCSTPALEHDEQGELEQTREKIQNSQSACILRTLSIEAATTSSPQTSLLANNLPLSFTNGVTTTAALAPQ